MGGENFKTKVHIQIDRKILLLSVHHMQLPIEFSIYTQKSYRFQKNICSLKQEKQNTQKIASNLHYFVPFIHSMKLSGVRIAKTSSGKEQNILTNNLKGLL